MMKPFRLLALFLLSLATTLPAAHSFAQTVNAAQQVTLQGLRSVANHGSFTAAAYASDGSLFLLLNQQDGLRLLKTDATGATVLAQTQDGAKGDIGLAMAIDPSGNVYVTGTSSSGMLAGTAGVPYPAPADTSTNSFLAKYDSNLNLIFLTFLGAGRTSAAGVAATADGAFVTGITFSSTFPVTPAGIQQTPASGSSENGFVERFSASGALMYATYLTGANGNTAPTGIAADSSDAAYVTGSTTATGYPTIAALLPDIPGSTYGFLTKLTPTGDGFTFSTFIPGNGLNAIAFDASSQSLLLSGNVALGQFPVATVAMPLTSASYQTLLRIPADGQSVTGSVLLVPGTQSFVSVGPNETAWVSGALTTPLFPGDTQPAYFAGDSFLLHLTATNVIDETLRFGGLAVDNPSYASLTSTVAAPAVAASGTSVALPGSINAEASSSLLTTQRFDFPLVQAPNAVLPSTLSDVLPSPASCTNSSQCSGSGGLLALVSTNSSAPSLSLSANDLPNLTLRNHGSATASGLSLSVSGYTLASDCGATLDPSNACSIALTGAGPGSITVSAANAATYTLALPVNALAPDAIAVSTDELDFGIVTSTSGAATRSLTISNLSTASQTFAAELEPGATTAYSFSETATTCTAGSAAGTFTLSANSSCSLTLGLTASSTSANDGPANGFWKIGTRDVKLTGFSQAASLNVSATEVDFGTQFSNTTALDLPRYLYLSNNSTVAIAHLAAALPSGSPFTVSDDCPSVLEPHSICQLALTYLSAKAPSSDSAMLSLDDGISVLLTGETLPPASVTGSTTNPNLSVSPTSLNFTTAVAVTGVSGTSQAVTVANTGTAAFTLAIAVSGDFSLVNGCPATLAGGASCQVMVRFAPSQPGQRQGLLSVTAGSNFAPAYVTLSGTGLAILPINDGTLNLGQNVVGEPLVVWYQVQQSFPSLTVSSNSALFGVAIAANAGATPSTLPPSSFTQSATGPCANCYIGVEFLSQTADAAGATLTLSTAAGGNPYSLTLTATALPVQGLLLTPLTQDFGTVAVNSSSPAMTFTLADLLPASSGVTITSVTTTGDFSIAANTTGGASCSGTLAPSASCYVQVTFAPTATGMRNGTLTVVTSSGTATANLTGDGVPDPGLALNPDALVFDNATGTTATQQTIAVKNTGQATLTLGPLVVSDPSFSATTTCATLAPTATCSITVQFAATSATVAATLSIPVTAMLSGQTTSTVYTVPLTGGYTAEDAGLEILPGEVNFGSTATGALGYTRQFTLSNLTSKQLAVTLTMPRQFPLADASGCSMLAANTSCEFSVSFLPATAGALTGTVFAQGAPSDGSANVQALAYMLGYGVGTGSLTLTGNLIPNTALNFGSLTSGQTAQQTLTLTNSGTAPVTVRRISSDPPFLSTTTCGAALAPNASCKVTLTYAPIDELATGSGNNGPRGDAGELIVESDAASGPITLDLTGTATPVFSSSPASSAVLATFDLSQGSLTFANTTVGNASATQTVTLTNTGTATLHLLSLLASTDYTATSNCTTLLPGTSCNLTVTFTPTTASSSTVRPGTLEISSDAATSLEFISLFGVSSAAPLTLNPTALDFGTVNVGANGQLGLSVTNTTAAPITFASIGASGDYSVAQGTCPADGATLAAGASCTLQVTFTPTASGTQTGTLSLASDATTLPLTVSLTGVGAMAHLQVTPGALSFGNIAVASPASLTLTLLNTGNSEVTGIATTISGTNSAEFAVTVPCSVTQLAPNQGCTLTVTFTPSAVGAQTATLSIASSDPSSPLTVPLTGSGSQPGAFTLTVGGTSSATATVASGTPAVFALALTPLNGFTGAVALTCSPVNPGQFASCSLLSSTLTLNGSAQNSTATINTITSAAGVATSVLLGAGLMLGPLVVICTRRRRNRPLPLLLYSLLAVIDIGALAGCGGGTPAANSNLRYTPAGTYQYQVTATSTSGPQISSTVTLNIVVQ